MQAFNIDVVTRGREGYARYAEAAHTHDFYWEFCGAGCVVSANVPSASEWPKQLPWAAGRRDEVVARVGEALCRHSGPGCTWHLNDVWLEIRSPTH
jgi:hypothetical protein